jgi:hypothetical protein
MGSPERRPLSGWWALAPVTVAAGLLFALGAGYVWRAKGEAAGQIALLSSRVAELERRLLEKREPIPVPVAPQPAVVSEHERELDRQLARPRNEYAAAAAEKIRLEERVSALLSETAQIRGESQAARAEVERLQGNLRDTEVALARAGQELDALRSTRSADALLIAEQRVRLDQLAARVREQAEELLQGNIYIMDAGNRRIRKVGLDGIITTVAGRGTPGSSGDGGPALEATFNPFGRFGPAGLAVDADGALYPADGNRLTADRPGWNHHDDRRGR